MKKKNKLGIWITLLILIAAAVGSIAMYPVFTNYAEKYQEEHQESSFSWYMYNWMYEGAYVLYYESMEEQQENKILPYELFLVDKEAFLDLHQESYLSLAAHVNELVYDWRGSIEELRNGIDYVVLDEAQEVLISYGQEAELTSIAKKQAAFDSEHGLYQAVIQLTFDSLGQVSFQQYGGGITTDMQRELEQYYYHNLLIENTEDEVESFYFVQPKDFTILYGITETSGFFDDNPNQWHINRSYRNAGVQYWFYGMLVVLAGLALILTRIKRFGLCQSRISKIPFEIAIMIFFISFALWEPLIALIRDTDTGILLMEIQAEPLIGGFAAQITAGINILSWVLILGLWFCSVASLGQLFSFGFKGYLLKRSLCIRVLKWIKVKCVSVIDVIKDEDFNTSGFKRFRRIIFLQFIIISIMCICWIAGVLLAFIYSCILLFLAKKYIKAMRSNYRLLLAQTNRIAEGDLEFEIKEELGVFDAYKKALENVQKGFQKAVAQKIASQNMKTELITNVSHDLKTPLTAIITYINLLQDENITDDERKQYIETIDQKAGRLKVLIEDLFEISKAESKNISLNIVEVDLENLLKQVKLELEDKITEAGLTFRMVFPEHKVLQLLDSQKTYRIFENLYINCVKYAFKGSRVYVELVDEIDEVCIWVKNTSAEEIGISQNDLSERFVRGDLARNTEGSGLGLAIARSFTEVQGGYLTIQIDGDFFKVGVHFPKRSSNLEENIID